MDESMCCFKDQKNWKFLIVEKENRPQLTPILPGKILEKL